MDWARTQNNLGIAYADRIRGDRAENLEHAIECYKQALEVPSGGLPVDWAAAQNNWEMPMPSVSRGDRAANLEQAIERYKRALEVRTRPRTSPWTEPRPRTTWEMPMPSVSGVTGLQASNWQLNTTNGHWR